MAVKATFENGHIEYVTGYVKNPAGEVTDATVSIYPKEIEIEDLPDLKSLYPSVLFEIV